tara:strand:- start:232 stop:408 length:177 start_codon:yes stop_codon:yes gene_type:complete
MKLIEKTDNGVWFEDSYGHECFATTEELGKLLPNNEKDCEIYGSSLLKDKCELSLTIA